VRNPQPGVEQQLDELALPPHHGRSVLDHRGADMDGHRGEQFGGLRRNGARPGLQGGEALGTVRHLLGDGVRSLEPAVPPRRRVRLPSIGPQREVLAGHAGRLHPLGDVGAELPEGVQPGGVLTGEACGVQSGVQCDQPVVVDQGGDRPETADLEPGEVVGEAVEVDGYRSFRQRVTAPSATAGCR
jgi:hypothetical protein